MSHRTYRATFTRPEARSAVTRAMRAASVRVSEERQRILAQVAWRPLSDEPFAAPDELREFVVPDDWTADCGIKGEQLLVSAADDGITVSLLDWNVPTASCETVVRRFIQALYQEATTEDLEEKDIRVTPVAVLMHHVCQHCAERVLELPYRCPVCGRAFCYPHRRPESHGCDRRATRDASGVLHDEVSPPAVGGRVAPKVLVSKVPCG